MTLVLLRPFIVIDVHLPIPDRSCCSFIILGNMSGVESIATPPGLYTLLLSFYFVSKIVFLFCKVAFLLLGDSSSCWFLLNIQCR